MISIIVAIGKNRELGKENKLLWHIPEDFKRFKNLTSGHVVIMGRKTYESLPEKFRPLPSRTNIVITRNQAWTPLGCTVYHSLEEAIEKEATFASSFAKASADKKASASRGEIFIIGGASIYKQGIKYADKLYLTLVEKEYPDADAFFPDYPEFKKVVFVENHNSGNIKFKFIELEK